MHQTDEELIQQFMNQEETAFNELYNRYEKRLYDLAYRLSNSDADAKDAVQETFLEVHRSIYSLREPKYFSLWIRKILLSKIKQIFAKNKEMVLPDHDYRYVNSLENYTDFLPVDHLHYETDQLQLQDFINELSPHYREVLILTYFEHLKNHEIADLLEIPIGTVKSRLNMARSILKQHIESYEKKNNVKLDFHGDALLGAITTGVLFKSLQQQKLLLKQGVTHVMQGTLSTFVKTALCAGLFTGGTLAVAGVMNHNDEKDSTDMLENHTVSNRKSQIEKANFSPVTLEETTYETPYQAYMGLKKYLHCGYEIEQASEEELQQMQKLYNALKEENGIYYNLLKKQGWIENFEKFSNH